MINLIKTHKFVIFFIILFFVIRLFELNQVGETWDEIAKIRNGQLHLKAVANLDFSYNTWVIHKEHPPFGKVLLALPTYLSKVGVTILDDKVYEQSKQYNLARLVSLIFACGTLFLTYLISKRWFNKNVAWLSVIGLAMFPHFVAHSFIATLESPQTFFTTLLFFVLIYFENSSKLKDFFIIALVIALGLLVKLSSMFFLPLPFLFSLTRIVISPTSWRITGDPLKNLFKKNLIIYFVALILFVLFWPWLWANPILRFIETLGHFNVQRTEYFLGHLVNPPFYYYLYYFAISVPVIYFVGFILGIKNIFSRRYLLIFIWFLLPFLASFSGFKQNGVRYLHSSFPAFSILVAVGFEHLILDIRRKYILLAILFVSLVMTNISVSPYYLDYYNIFVSGSSASGNGVYVNRLAQFGWWGEGTKQAIIFLNKYTKDNVTLCIKVSPAHVLPKINKNYKVYYDDSNVLSCTSDYLLINTLDQWTKNYTVDTKIYENIYESKASDAPLVQIFKHK